MGRCGDVAFVTRVKADKKKAYMPTFYTFLMTKLITFYFTKLT